MNRIFPFLIIISLVASIFKKNPDVVISAGMEGAKNALTTVISFAGVMCFWSGILEVLEKSGMGGALKNILYPITKRLFPKLKKEGRALEKITQNICANMLGVGNAATPAGIEAMEELDRLNNKGSYPSDEMCIFTLINTASVQIIPTTVISLLSSAGMKDASKIILPVWICSCASLVSALLFMKIILRLSKRRKR